MRANKGVYIATVCFLGCIRTASTTLETVWLKDVTTISQINKRTLSNTDLPNELAFRLRRGSETRTLNLRRNHYIYPNADFYFERKFKDGESRLVKSRNLEKEDLAFYQDEENWAFVTVRCVKGTNNECVRMINGNIRIGDRMFDIRPAGNDVKSRKLLEVPGHLGELYVLKDQSVIPNHILADWEGKSRRQPKDEYNVKVVVVIDLGLWDFFSSMISVLNPLRKCRKVMDNIREYYSHIMNGVNLLYKGIGDISISINVILSDFVYLKNNVFQHKASKVVTVNEKKHIEAEDYLMDARTWDKAVGKNRVPVFDHGMLFTRYDMYFDTTDNTGVVGYTETGDVCREGSIMSLVEERGLFWTVFTAAHELGHRNCVGVPGFLYDIHEYMDFVQCEPVMAYNVTEQCRSIIGRYSKFCETYLEDVCDKMRCTDPTTGLCMYTYRGAARGTECGQNKWCIEARCVSKG